MFKNLKKQSSFIVLVLLTVLSAIVVFPALGQTRHLASREIRHAEIIREIAESGDYPQAHRQSVLR